jgi:hypothetical protein
MCRSLPPLPVLVLLLLAATGRSAATAETSRGHAFEFLRLPGEPVGRSLSGAHLASVSGPASLAWNPAGLGTDAASAVVLAHTTWEAGTSWEWGALSLRALGGALGASCGLLRSGGLEGYDRDGRPTGTFTPQQACASIGYGRPLGAGLSAGLSLEGMLAGDGIDPPDRGWAMSAGLTSRLGRADLALAALHWAPAFERDGERYPLPVTLRAGASLRLGGGTRAHAAADYVSGGRPAFRLGAEWAATRGVSALAGATLDPESEAPTVRPTAGMQIEFGRMRFAYGFQPAGALEASHQLSLTCLLGAGG